MRDQIATAVQHFWTVRDRQAANQGLKSGERDRGTRSAVTGGAQLDGFADLIAAVLKIYNVPEDCIYTKRQPLQLPGYFRSEKKWDVLVIHEGRLLLCIEFKSQVGSFGNNQNNRAEEVVGLAHDLWTAYGKGAFAPSARPWLGFLMLLEDHPTVRRPVGVEEPHFKVFPEFRGASYIGRYRILLENLVRERLLDAACLILSPQSRGAKVEYAEPSPELAFATFARSMAAHALAHFGDRLNRLHE
ncbi:MAG: restriction endonuclease [Verrucomicrobiae bacterium]|nr:restriction endonuclease [Verrucomicrobiae bacterium]